MSYYLIIGTWAVIANILHFHSIYCDWCAVDETQVKKKKLNEKEKWENEHCGVDPNKILINIIYSPVSDCPDVDQTSSGSVQCSSMDGMPLHSKCSLACPANTAPLYPIPKFYTCGPAGVWNMAHPYIPFKPAPCGGWSSWNLRERRRGQKKQLMTLEDNYKF